MVFELIEKIDLPAGIADAWDFCLFFGTVGLATAVTVAVGMAAFLKIEDFLVSKVGVTGTALFFLLSIYAVILPIVLLEWRAIEQLFGG